MAKKTKRGGRRKNSGRKPATDPKIRITFYVEKSVVKANGGAAKCRKISEDNLRLQKQIQDAKFPYLPTN